MSPESESLIIRYLQVGSHKFCQNWNLGHQPRCPDTRHHALGPVEVVQSSRTSTVPRAQWPDSPGFFRGCGEPQSWNRMKYQHCKTISYESLQFWDTYSIILHHLSVFFAGNVLPHVRLKDSSRFQPRVACAVRLVLVLLEGVPQVGGAWSKNQCRANMGVLKSKNYDL